jgi:hypothetical protein
MDTRGEQSRLLYIPDFHLWERFYESKIPRRSLSEVKDRTAPKGGPANVKLQFVSPTEETVDQAASEINSTSKANLKAKKRKFQHTENLPKQLDVNEIVRASISSSNNKSSRSSSPPQKKRKKNDIKQQRKEGFSVKENKKFSYKTLNDIFSKSG